MRRVRFVAWRRYIRLDRDPHGLMLQDNMKTALIILGTVLLAFLSFMAGQLSVHFGNVNAEYRTIGLMSRIGDFVEANGRWPRGWNEVGVEPFRGVHIEWDIPLAELDEWRIHKAVNVVTKKWNVHPHYGGQVELLAKVIRQARERKPASALPPSP